MKCTKCFLHFLNFSQNTQRFILKIYLYIFATVERSAASIVRNNLQAAPAYRARVDIFTASGIILLSNVHEEYGNFIKTAA